VKRRRITRDLKDIPSETTVRAIMGAAQQRISNNGYLPHQIINLDETAINWGLGPTYVYCAGNADRGEQEITVFYIFKHSKTSDESPDQTEAIKRGGKLILWQDNCAVHKVSCLDDIYTAANVMVDYLPQVLDLVVNGPCMKKRSSKLRSLERCPNGSVQSQVFINVSEI